MKPGTSPFSNSMPNFMDLSREVRDLIYAEAMTGHKTLIAKNEYDSQKWERRSEYHGARGGRDGRLGALLALPLFEVNRTISSEAIEFFYATNEFKISPQVVLGKPSVFTKHALLFRKIVLRFGNLHWPTNLDVDYVGLEGLERIVADFDDVGLPGQENFVGDATYGGRIRRHCSLSKKQIETLSPMFNLQYLELDLMEVGQIVMIERYIPSYMKMLQSTLLASLPMSIRKKEGIVDRGVWIFGDWKNCSWGPLILVGTIWEGVGINIDLSRARKGRRYYG